MAELTGFPIPIAPISAEFAKHKGEVDPHTQYALKTALAAHEAEGNPHGITAAGIGAEPEGTAAAAAGSIVDMIGEAEGIAPLDGGARIPASALPEGVAFYMGTHPSSELPPTPAPTTLRPIYKITGGGTLEVGSEFASEGDLIIWTGAGWGMFSPFSDGRVKWAVVSGDTTLSAEYNGMSLWVTGAAVLTLAPYSALPPGWAVEIIPAAAVAITIAPQVGDSVRDSEVYVTGDAAVARTPASGVFVAVGGVGA